MDDSLNINIRQDIHALVTVTYNQFYKDNRPLIEGLLYKSLEAKHGAYPLFDIQAELLGHIIATESARRKYLKWKSSYAKAQQRMVKNGASLERIKDAQHYVEAMDNSALATKWFIAQLRSIGDGIAWWFFNYDRASLRVIVEHDFISVPDLGAGLLSEIEMFATSAAQGKRVLLNSITNFLRVGDVTVYDETEDKYELVEVKTGQKRNARTLRQGEHMALVQNAIDTGTHSLTGHTITKIVTNKPLLTYMRSLENAMREAQRAFCSTRVFGEYLSFAVINMRMLRDLPVEDAEQKRNDAINRMMSVFPNKRDVMMPTMYSILPTAHFSRILAPYVIYPIAPDLRIGLLTSDFFLMSQMNISGLARWMTKRGWETEVLLPDSPIPEGTSEFIHIPVLRVGKSNSPIVSEIPLDILTIAAMELWMPESIERLVESGTVRGIPNTDYAVNFLNKGKYAWD